MDYFAYGTNTDIPLMKQRCPRSRVICPAVLSGYRKEDLNILPEEGSETLGLLWDITADIIDVAGKKTVNQ